MHSIKRNSSIELLRILSMLIIVIYHYEARNFNLYVVASDRVGEPDLLPQLLTHSIGKLGVPFIVFATQQWGGQDAPYNHGRKVAFRQYLLLAIFPILSFYYQHDS